MEHISSGAVPGFIAPVSPSIKRTFEPVSTPTSFADVLNSAVSEDEGKREGFRTDSAKEPTINRKSVEKVTHTRQPKRTEKVKKDDEVGASVTGALKTEEDPTVPEASGQAAAGTGAVTDNHPADAGTAPANDAGLVTTAAPATVQAGSAQAAAGVEVINIGPATPSDQSMPTNLPILATVSPAVEGQILPQTGATDPGKNLPVEGAAGGTPGGAAISQAQNPAPTVDIPVQAVVAGAVDLTPAAVMSTVSVAEPAEKIDATGAGQAKTSVTGSVPAATVSLQSLAGEVAANAGSAANGQNTGSGTDGKSQEKGGHSDAGADQNITGSLKAAQPSNPTTSPFHLSSTLSSTGAIGGQSTDSTVQNQQVIQQILKQIEPAIRSGRNSLHIQLQPESLGRIDLHLTSSDQGVVVTFRASRPGTQAALENNMGDLRQALSDAGIQLNHLGVGQQGQSASGFTDKRNPASGYGNQNSATTEPEIDIPEKTWKPASMVDYRA